MVDGLTTVPPPSTMTTTISECKYCYAAEDYKIQAKNQPNIRVLYRQADG